MIVEAKAKIDIFDGKELTGQTVLLERRAGWVDVRFLTRDAVPDAVKLARGICEYEDRMQYKSVAIDSLRTIADRILAEWEAKKC